MQKHSDNVKPFKEFEGAKLTPWEKNSVIKDAEWRRFIYQDKTIFTIQVLKNVSGKYDAEIYDENLRLIKRAEHPSLIAAKMHITLDAQVSIYKHLNKVDISEDDYIHS